MLFQYGKRYRTAFGTAMLHETKQGRLDFTHFNQAGETHCSLDHRLDGTCEYANEAFRKYDIIGPVFPERTITVTFSEEPGKSGWTVIEGDKSADQLGIDEMLGLFVGLTFKSPVRALAWMKTAADRAAEEKAAEERIARRVAEEDFIQTTNSKELCAAADALSGLNGPDQRRIAEVGLEWLDMLLRKNADYGSSVWQAPPMPGLTTGDVILVRIFDKISRLRSLLQQPAQVAGESLADTMRDLGGYCLLWLARPIDPMSRPIEQDEFQDEFCEE